jgi:hypothetical protein
VEIVGILVRFLISREWFQFFSIKYAGLKMEEASVRRNVGELGNREKLPRNRIGNLSPTHQGTDFCQQSE